MTGKQSKRRRSSRLAGYDYTQPGAYFVTICSYQREEIFGRVFQGEVIHTPAGKVALEQWFRTSEIRSGVDLYEDEFVVMPNHVHGILHFFGGIVGARRRRAPTRESFGRPVCGSLGTIVRSYKSAVTRAINQLNGRAGDRIWQRNYYEHVIRDEEDLHRVRQYIQDNPAKWQVDQYYTPQ